jgi:CubicO group peptidase (beta-lactamase class C family)
MVGVGTKRASGAEPIGPDTRFQWASTTKTFTAATALALAEDGAIALDAALPFQPAITLRQLLTHTAGYPTEFENYPPSFALGDHVLANTGIALWSPPGAVFNYSNPGFAVAGYALEHATGVPYATLVEQRIFARAGMDATFDAALVASGDFAFGHSDDAELGPLDHYYHHAWYGPMGGAWGSARDLGRWTEVLLAHGEDVLSAAAVAAYLSPQTKTGGLDGRYGHGVFIDEGRAPKVLSHGGSVSGFLTDWTIVPEAGFGFALVVNGDAWYPGEISDLAVDLFVAPANVAVDVAGTALDYVGSYRDDNVFGEIVVSEQGGALVANFVDAGVQATLTHYDGDLYFGYYEPAGTSIDMTFWRDGGAADYIVSLWGVAARQ